MKALNADMIPIVSVVMPAYNYARYISAAIKSVLDQTYPFFELLIIDNHSTDNTEQIVESFSDDRIRYYKFANNGILAASKNCGARKARGQYIAFIDADDVWLPNKLEIQMEFFKRYPFTGLVFCAVQFDSVDKRYNGHIFGKKRLADGWVAYHELLNANFITTSSVVIRASVLQEINYFDEDPRMALADDWDAWLRVVSAYRMAYIPQVFVKFRLHHSNLSKSGHQFEHEAYVIDKHEKSGWVLKKQANRARSNCFIRAAWSTVGTHASLSRALFIRALKVSSRSPKLMCLSVVGVLLSLFPFLCRLLKTASLDRKVINFLFNPQSL